MINARCVHLRAWRAFIQRARRYECVRDGVFACVTCVCARARVYVWGGVEHPHKSNLIMAPTSQLDDNRTACQKEN